MRQTTSKSRSTPSVSSGTKQTRRVKKGETKGESDYIDRPSRESLVKREQDSDTNLERRKMREALANIYRQSSAAEIEELLWRGWAWEDPPPPPSAARLAAATGPNAVPLFAESLDPMEKVGWESGAEYLERIEVVQAMRDQLSNERALAGEPWRAAIPRRERCRP